MQIKTVSIIGLGALGIMFGNHLSKQIPRGQLRIIADTERITKYKNTQIYCNGKLCDYYYVTPEEDCVPADLLIFAVKFNDLKGAVDEARNHVGPDTIIISLLNGITSEAIIAQTYGDNVIDCVAQGMDAVKEGNKLTYNNMGMLCIGDRSSDIVSQKIKTTAQFLDNTRVPYIIDPDMKKRMWGKFMLNVGVNQTVAVYESNYGEIQRNGPARDLMISAMKEVIVLSRKEGVNLTEDDLNYWLEVLKPLNPTGKPSMRQDLEAKRLSEVGLFSGTVLSLGRKYSVETPVNKELYDRIKEIENKF